MRKVVLSFFGMLLLTSCSLNLQMGAQPTPEVPTVVEERDDVIMAKGILEPASWSRLGFDAAGEVIDVLVSEGDVVAKGDVLVRIDQANARLTVKQAEADLEVARARLALLEAGSKPEEIAAAEASLEAAQAAVMRAEAERDKLLAYPTTAETAAASADAAFTKAQQKVAEDAYDNDPPDEVLARHELYAANEALRAAEARLADLRAGSDINQLRAAKAGIQAASADRDVVQAQLDLLQAGPAEEEIAVADAAVARAQVSLEMARVALADLEVRAPFQGTVTRVEAQVGNAVVPGQVACILATIGQLQVRTTDLSELDVAVLEAGQPVKVTLDALPDSEFDGVVQKVALRSEDYRGEAVYAVTVDLVGAGGAPLRWGMTAWVEFRGS